MPVTLGILTSNSLTVIRMLFGLGGVVRRAVILRMRRDDMVSLGGENG